LGDVGDRCEEEGRDYLHPEELIPEDRILRLIDRYVDFSFIRPKLEPVEETLNRQNDRNRAEKTFIASCWNKAEVVERDGSRK